MMRSFVCQPAKGGGVTQSDAPAASDCFFLRGLRRGRASRALSSDRDTGEPERASGRAGVRTCARRQGQEVRGSPGSARCQLFHAQPGLAQQCRNLQAASQEGVVQRGVAEHVADADLAAAVPRRGITAGHMYRYSGGKSERKAGAKVLSPECLALQVSGEGGRHRQGDKTAAAQREMAAARTCSGGWYVSCTDSRKATACAAPVLAACISALRPCLSVAPRLAGSGGGRPSRYFITSTRSRRAESMRTSTPSASVDFRLAPMSTRSFHAKERGGKQQQIHRGK